VQLEGDINPRLIPIYDRNGEKIYKGPPMKRLYNGEAVPDLAAINKVVRASIAELPEGARRIVKPRNEIIRSWLLELYLQNPSGAQNIDVSRIHSNLPPEVEHVPVFLDKNLLEKRQGVEMEYLGRARRFVVADSQVPSELTGGFHPLRQPVPQGWR
jgi:hypothetical protein